MPEDVHGFKQGQRLRRKGHPPSEAYFEFTPANDGVCCDNCGEWGLVGTAHKHANCSPICAHCGQREEKHPAGWCLFRPTRWERFNAEWQGYR